jgi:hypothetical protein
MKEREWYAWYMGVWVAEGWFLWNAMVRETVKYYI